MSDTLKGTTDVFAQVLPWYRSDHMIDLITCYVYKWLIHAYQSMGIFVQHPIHKPLSGTGYIIRPEHPVPTSQYQGGI